MRTYRKFSTIGQTISLNMGGVTPISVQFPLGNLYQVIWLKIHLALVLGTGTTPITEGEYGIVRNILLKTTDGISINACGRMLKKDANMFYGLAPDADPISAASGDYYISIPLVFVNQDLLRPDDTGLDTSRYKSLDLYITMGTITDLLGVPGTATVTADCEVSVIQSPIPVTHHAKPTVYPVILQTPPFDPNVVQYIDIERASDLALTSILLFVTNTATAGVPATGTASDTTLANLQLRDNYGDIVEPTSFRQIKMVNMLERLLPTAVTGCRLLHLPQDKSIFSAYPTGNKSLLRLQWTNGILSSSQVTALYKGFRTLKVATGRG